MFRPRLPAVWANRIRFLHILTLDPSINTVHVEPMLTLALNGSAIIPAKLTAVAGHLKFILTYRALVVFDVPLPFGYREPVINLNFHLLAYNINRINLIMEYSSSSDSEGQDFDLDKIIKFKGKEGEVPN